MFLPNKARNNYVGITNITTWPYLIILRVSIYTYFQHNFKALPIRDRNANIFIMLVYLYSLTQYS